MPGYAMSSRGVLATRFMGNDDGIFKETDDLRMLTLNYSNKVAGLFGSTPKPCVLGADRVARAKIIFDRWFDQISKIRDGASKKSDTKWFETTDESKSRGKFVDELTRNGKLIKTHDTLVGRGLTHSTKATPYSLLKGAYVAVKSYVFDYAKIETADAHGEQARSLLLGHQDSGSQSDRNYTKITCPNKADEAPLASRAMLSVRMADGKQELWLESAAPTPPPRREPDAAAAATDPTIDAIRQQTLFKRLREEGLITEDEFAAKKQQLLGL